jgi:hypothetical protein
MKSSISSAVWGGLTMDDFDTRHAAAQQALDRLRAGEQPSQADLTGAPLIDLWYLSERQGYLCLNGEVSGHPRLPDGPVTTSILLGIDEKAGWARTYGRWYALGRSLRSVLDAANLRLVADGGLFGDDDPDALPPPLKM